MYLGLDLGTTNVKAVIMDDAGGIVGSAGAPVGLAHPLPQAAQQGIEEIHSAVVGVLGQAGSADQRAAVRAIGVSSQGGALQMLDGRRRPIGPVISWMDSRGGPYDKTLTDRMGRDWFVRHTGHDASAVALGQLLRLRQEQPAMLAEPNAVGFVGDVIVSRLTGRRAHDATSLHLAVLYNPALDRADPELLGLLGLSERQLPDLLGPLEAAGPLDAQIARVTGLRAGIPVGPAVHDQYASAIGLGVVQPGQVMLGGGTAWVLLAVQDRLADPAIEGAFVCRHLVEGRFGQLASMGNGGSAIAWAAGLTGMASSVEAVDEAIGAVVPGSDGLRFWPLLVGYGGARLPAGLPGRLDGIRLGHGRAHLLRSVVEGLCLELGRYLRLLERGGLDVRGLALSGVAARSSVTPQIVADVTGLAVEVTTQTDSSARGAALLARAMLEPDRSLMQLSTDLAPPARPVQPGPHAGVYQSMLREFMASLPAKPA